ncbi:MAG: U32 family peptidase [Christensenella sp.]|nr:MAG: U32 family peptidase [Christensenella sp.]
MLELLAPAGDMTAFETALMSGADAVYLGLDDFNARMKAQNFTSENIADVVKRAHFYGAKVYVAINTILQNEEFTRLISLVKSAVCAKVDAFLVQDIGVCKVLKDCFPDICLHASTQMGVHNLYGAQVAKELGVSRVVLSRETKLEDIKAIKENTDLEIEYFVQGALCIAFSGNCYLSSVEQGASGNRGLCKQMCRLSYKAKAGKDEDCGYLFSARDLCLAKSVNQLARAGVCSFKIEGRLRREGYVATAVQTYRKAVDFASRDRDYIPSKSEMRDLKVAYSRGEYLERAYLDDGTPFVVEKRFNNHTGVKIGYVKSVKEFKDGLFEIFIVSDKELEKGDGLKFFDKDVEKASLGVGQASRGSNGVYSVVSKTKVKPGWQVNLICDAKRTKSHCPSNATSP